jgi:alginate O-acetyltransferase complex protein AlgI
MNFADIHFWALLFLGLFVILSLRLVARAVLKDRIGTYDRTALAFLGLFLLANVSVITVTIFLIVAFSSYFGLRWLSTHDSSRHKWYLILLVPVQLLPLIYYKYSDFFLNGVLGNDFSELKNMAIPVGISFYSFQMVSCVIDTLGFKKPVPRLLDFLNYAGFFPQIVAGPIERRSDLLPQMESFRFRWSSAAINEGIGWIVLGVFFKLCMSDSVSVHFYGKSQDNAYLIWMDNLLFGLRIYYDFAGYSLVALGLGKCLGINLTLNFLSPYCASSIVDFWRRWHVTLSQWFRDYIYVPMGGGRTPKWWFNVMLVFIVSGIWHGAGWNFVVWGALHGAFLIVNRLWATKTQFKLFRPIAWGLMAISVLFAWLCFYETNPTSMFSKMATLSNPSSYSLDAAKSAVAVRDDADNFVIACLLILSASVLVLEWRSIRSGKGPYELLRRPVVLAVLVVLTVWLAPGSNNEFIYFAF